MSLLVLNANRTESDINKSPLPLTVDEMDGNFLFLYDKISDSFFSFKEFFSSIVATSNITISENQNFVKCDASSGPFTIILCSPDQAVVGIEYIFKKIDSSSNIITIYNTQLTLQNEVCRFISDGTTWESTT
jgi:hypothetical protein